MSEKVFGIITPISVVRKIIAMFRRRRSETYNDIAPAPAPTHIPPKALTVPDTTEDLDQPRPCLTELLPTDCLSVVFDFLSVFEACHLKHTSKDIKSAIRSSLSRPRTIAFEKFDVEWDLLNDVTRACKKVEAFQWRGFDIICTPLRLTSRPPTKGPLSNSTDSSHSDRDPDLNYLPVQRFLSLPSVSHMTDLRMDTYYGVSLTTLRTVGTSFESLTTLNFRLAMRPSERHNVKLINILAGYTQVRHLAIDVYESKFTRKMAKKFSGFKSLESFHFSTHAGVFYPLDSLVTLTQSLSPEITKCSFDFLDIFYVSCVDQRKRLATKDMLTHTLKNIKVAMSTRGNGNATLKCVSEKSEYCSWNEHHCTLEFEEE